MRKWYSKLIIVGIILVTIPATAFARGTRYMVKWPKGHIGPVYVQVYDIRCSEPFEVWDRFKVWVTWDQETKCYDIGNLGVYTIKMYKYDYNKGPMIISGNAASFKIRYSLCPPWI
ncbi:hypothetical protein ACFL2Q_09870 [Thermodesulfobacteriota bacterium]